jgi:hypothetical protein
MDLALNLHSLFFSISHITIRERERESRIGSLLLHHEKDKGYL